MAKQKQKDRKTIKKGYFKKKSLKKPNIEKKPPEKKFEIQRGGGNDDVESKAINDLHGYVKWLNKYGDERAKLSIETTKDATGLWNCRCSVTIGDNEHRSLGKGITYIPYLCLLKKCSDCVLVRIEN